jgi:hypothetical protein
MPVSSRSVLFAAPLACALAVLLGVKEPARVVAEETQPKPVSLGEAFECTAIGDVIRANNGQVPKNGSELVQALAKLGDFAQLPVPFSAVATDSGLLRPRVVIAPRPGRAVAAQEENPEPGLPDLTNPTRLLPPGARPLPAQSPISTAKVTQPHIEGRLFLAANMEGKSADDIRVKTIEFISWNTRKKKFDFGVIDCAAEKPEIQILDGVRCFACHKNRGPILGQGPWSNTTHNDVVRAAALQALAPQNNLPGDDPKTGPPRRRLAIPEFQPGVFGSPFVSPELRQRTTFDGMSLVAGEPEVCDSAIRFGGDIARDREIYKAMTRSADGRKGLAILLAGIASPQPIAQVDQQLRVPLDQTFNSSYATFAKEFVSLHKSMSNTLADFSPSGSMGSLRSVVTNQPAGWGGGSFQRTDIVIVWGGTPKSVSEYDSRRAEGDPAMPSHRLPSNPRSFLRPAVGVPGRASNAVSTVTLARAIGLSEGDRAFLSRSLADLAGKVGKPKVTAATLAKDVFNSQPFADALKAGNLPDREEFKDLFAEALDVVAKTHKTEGLQLVRGDYASGPSGAVAAGQEYREPAIVPTTACMRCHDVRGAAKPTAFNPIPMLAFDPFDKAGREAWAKGTDAKKRAAVLARMTKRLVTDKDMPPEDAPEYAKFREKEAAAFDGIKDWLEAELKRANGN